MGIISRSISEKAQPVSLSFHEKTLRYNDGVNDQQLFTHAELMEMKSMIDKTLSFYNNFNITDESIVSLNEINAGKNGT